MCPLCSYGRGIFWYICQLTGVQVSVCYTEKAEQGEQVSVLFVGCLVVAIHGCFVGGFVSAMVGVVCGDAGPLLLCYFLHLTPHGYG